MEACKSLPIANSRSSMSYTGQQKFLQEVSSLSSLQYWGKRWDWEAVGLHLPIDGMDFAHSWLSNYLLLSITLLFTLLSDWFMRKAYIEPNSLVERMENWADCIFDSARLWHLTVVHTGLKNMIFISIFEDVRELKEFFYIRYTWNQNPHNFLYLVSLCLTCSSFPFLGESSSILCQSNYWDYTHHK